MTSHTSSPVPAIDALLPAGPSMNTIPGTRRILTASRSREVATSENVAPLNSISRSISSCNSSGSRSPRALVDIAPCFRMLLAYCAHRAQSVTPLDRGCGFSAHIAQEEGRDVHVGRARVRSDGVLGHLERFGHGIGAVESHAGGCFGVAAGEDHVAEVVEGVG